MNKRKFGWKFWKKYDEDNEVPACSTYEVIKTIGWGLLIIASLFSMRWVQDHYNHQIICVDTSSNYISSGTTTHK